MVAARADINCSIQVISNPYQDMYSLLPPKKKNTYNVRMRALEFVVPERDCWNSRDSKDILLRIIHKNSLISHSIMKF